MYIPGGNTLIFSRSQVVLKGGLRKRFPDLTKENFDLVKVHHSVNTLDPVVNHAKLHYAVVYIEEDPLDVVVVLGLDLPPCEDIGAIFVPQVLKKSWLVMQTGIDLVCGPEGEVCETNTLFFRVRELKCHRFRCCPLAWQSTTTWSNVINQMLHIQMQPLSNVSTLSNVT